MLHTPLAIHAPHAYWYHTTHSRPCELPHSTACHYVLAWVLPPAARSSVPPHALTRLPMPSPAGDYLYHSVTLCFTLCHSVSLQATCANPHTRINPYQPVSASITPYHSVSIRTIRIIRTNPYQSVSIRTNPYIPYIPYNPYQSVPIHTNPYQSVSIRTNPYNPYQSVHSVPIRTNPYQSVPIHINPYYPYQSVHPVSIHNNPYQSVPFRIIHINPYNPYKSVHWA